MSKLEMLFAAIDFVEKLVNAFKADELTEDERAAVKTKRDALNSKLDSLDVPTAPSGGDESDT